MLIHYIFFLIIFLTNQIKSNSNNVCKNYIDYFFINISRNCYYNPDLFQQTTQIIESHIGFSENYNVTTEDGYILAIFRIPRNNPKGVIILQHPLTTDSVVWVGQSNESLAFLLWHQGYDIWLPNHRGTFFSRKHINLTTSDWQYWNFSFHEIGLFDYTTIINFVKNKTGSNEIIFISHSMSTTSSLIYSALKPEEAANSIKIFISMSPICYLKHVRSPVKYIAPFTPALEIFNKLLKRTHLQGYDSRFVTSLRLFMLALPFKFLISVMVSILQGWNPHEIDPKLINLAISLHPRGYPWKIFYHYAQQFRSGGRFQMYDYGYRQNFKVYGSLIPPEYPVEKIITPTYLIYSEEDSLATIEDVELLYQKLRPRAKIYGKLRVDGINHVDYHYGKHRKEKIFNKIVQLLEKINNK